MNDEVVARMLPPAGKEALAKQTFALLLACVGGIAALFLVVYLLTVT
ncbi:hypothetical protein OG874_11320 [Nocardia sp. NBC_00565]|nr:hypothetical protein [Nocardia sp. NBC_00565]WUC05687.1 hypothetical protein OG874_11320 [Nocardia sp. NBC_00565]